MNYTTIKYEKSQNGIARITIDREDVRNVLNITVRQEIKTAIQAIDKDKEVRVLVITGAGDKAFIAGADVNIFNGKSPLEMEEFTRDVGQQLFSDIEKLRVPVIAMINGYCFGAGLELAMCCDIRIASENAKFGQPEINVGFMPGGGATQRLPKLVGVGRAKILIYTGKIIDAAEAERIGLVDMLVPQDELEDKVMELAENILGKSPLFIEYAKRTINKGMYTDLTSGLDYEKSNFALCFASEDCKEGISAFIEKRPAQFKGR